MKVFKFLFMLVLISHISTSYSEDHQEILNYLKEADKYSYFYKLIKKAHYEKLFIKEAKFKKNDSKYDNYVYIENLMNGKS